MWIFIFREAFYCQRKLEKEKQKNSKTPKKPKKVYVYYVYVTTNINLKELSLLHYDGSFRVNTREMRQHFNSIKLFSAK